MGKYDDDDEEPRSESKKPTDGADGGTANAKKGGPPVLLISLVAGGLFTLFCCCPTLGIGGYFLFFSGPAITGKWDQQAQFQGDQTRRQWEFFRNGTGKTKITEPGHLNNGKATEYTVHFEYKLLPGDPKTLEVRGTRVEGNAPEGLEQEIRETLHFTSVLAGDTLTLTPQGGRGGDEAVVLRRIR